MLLTLANRNSWDTNSRYDDDKGTPPWEMDNSKIEKPFIVIFFIT